MSTPVLSWGKLNPYQSEYLVDHHKRGVKAKSFGKFLILRNLPKDAKSRGNIKGVLGAKPGRLSYLNLFSVIIVRKAS